MRYLSIFILLLHFTSAKAADTLKLSIKQADSLFLKNNYMLLASQMNIEAQKAQILQAKLYPNPIFTANFNAFDPQNNIPFHVGNSGQMDFQFEQLILLGGKRKAQIELAKTNATISELEFQDLVRQLKFQLHTGMYSLSQQIILIEKYNAQLSLLDTIISAYEKQAAKGNIALKDVVRIKGVYLNLNNNRADIIKEYLSILSDIQTILQTDKIIKPEISEAELNAITKTLSMDELKNTALSNRADYLISQQNKLAAQQYYNYQKKLAVPDLNFITSYDQRGGAFQNQINIGFAIPLPLWNRNQGNRKSAKYMIQQYEYSDEGLKSKIFADIQSKYILYNQTVNEYKKSNLLYNSDFETTLRGVSENFKKRNVSILEFVDFFEAYNNALAEIARIKIQLATSAEELNLIIGKELY